MQYEIYDPTKHTLEVGTKIRLAGREGEIGSHYPVNVKYPQIIYWDDNTNMSCNIAKFPEIEIAISPLTIDKRVKGEILCMMSDQGTALDKFITIKDYLNSLEET